MSLSPEQRKYYKKAIEALIFCAGKAIKIGELSKIMRELSTSEILELIEELRKDYEDRGIRITEVAGGFRAESAPEVAEILRSYLGPKNFRWSKALLETLAIIAYYQPVTRTEISAMRGGVEVGPLLKVLLERGFIRVVGKKQVPGRPALYGTTGFFLEYFGLKSLEELPPLRELERIVGKEDI
ncbi:MAG: SMC-Scp complex subunit ScpB [Caldimicrobium sp.]|nr:SMC-Scp complex subunit ScpB [Caldimicrobium sp.]MCX7874346.1 SMC-Scp complex subunit ScpB [Caldimicrobium sp.]MDW8094703.1 SMC-Scp complex subunit ScpB [Caldimicrobium sp.]